MIVKSLLLMLKGLLYTLFGNITVPPIPDEFIDVLTFLKGYVIEGASIFFMFVDIRVFTVCLFTVYFVYGMVLSYKLIMWIIRKIPLINIE